MPKPMFPESMPLEALPSDFCDVCLEKAGPVSDKPGIERGLRVFAGKDGHRARYCFLRGTNSDGTTWQGSGCASPLGRLRCRSAQAPTIAVGLYNLATRKPPLPKPLPWSPETVGQWHVAYTRKYGITPGHYEAILQRQDGVCAGCREPGGLVIDHFGERGDPESVRALLCDVCNVLLSKEWVEDPMRILRAAAVAQVLPPRLESLYRQRVALRNQRLREKGERLPMGKERTRHITAADLE